MNDMSHQPLALDRIPSGVPGLDAILQGGFLRGGIYIIMGDPGGGKTILGNQICFGVAAGGGRAVYVTLLAETHARMLGHLRSLDFFTIEPIAHTLFYFSAYQALEQGGLDGLLELLRHIIHDQQPAVLVLDGLAAVAAIGLPVSDFKRFIHELNVFAEACACTTFLLAPNDDAAAHPEHTMVDGLIELSDRLVGQRAVREINVRKFRGSGYLRGRHAFEITGAGIAVYPRVEALLATPSGPAPSQRSRLSFGIARLDEMFGGGMLSDSVTMALGPSGSGKTLLGLHFLSAGADRGEPGLLFGFYETPSRAIARGDLLGFDFSGKVARGALELIWQPPLEGLIDALAERLLAAVRRRQVRRLFIDGFNAFQQVAIYPERTSKLMNALANELRALDVTTIFTFETRALFSPTIEVPATGVSELVDNIIYLRYFELRSQLYRLISILESRESPHDHAIREFTISDSGIDVAATFESAEAILTGIAHPLAADAGPRPSGRRSSRSRGRKQP
ncbi:MAG: recombinase RecA [Kouleothrix sp.]|nr:recombinase RecA [Kouleothrix sp.]